MAPTRKTRPQAWLPEAERDPFVMAEEAMTEQERQRFLARIHRSNPHLQGAHVADVLEMLYETDSYLAVREPFYEQHPEEFEVGPEKLTSALLLAQLGLYDEAPPFVILRDKLHEMRKRLGGIG